MSKIIILLGSPAAGKSSLASKLQAEGFRILCCDQIREELFGDASIQTHPERVFGTFFKKLEQLIKQKADVAIDNTNCKKADRSRLLQFIQKIDNTYEVEYYLLDTPLDICLYNNANRSRKVPVEVIYRLWNLLNNTKHLLHTEAKVQVIKYDPKSTNTVP